MTAPVNSATRKPLSSPSQKAARWNRLAHRWVAIVLALPILFIMLTGIFLQVRKPVDWIQPPTATGSQSYAPTASLEQVLEQVKTVPAMGVTGWEDIKLLDLRPKKGIIKVRNYSELETQVDASTAEVIQTGQRRNDIVGRMHDFSAWGARLWLGLPMMLGFTLLFLSGVYLNIKMAPAQVRSLARLFNRSPKQAKPSSLPTSKPLRLRLKSWLLGYHYWLGWLVLIPWGVVIASGLLLQVRYEVPWVMPLHQQGQGTVPTVEFNQVLGIAQQQTDLSVGEWKDVWRVYVYPDKGLTTVRAKNRQELQLDAQTGQVLQTSVRRTDWLEDIHEGKWRGLNLWLFLPVHILSVVLWVTGAVVAYSR